MADARRIYLDHNATTPLSTAVAAALRDFLGPTHGNPSSLHAEGRAARALVESARRKVAESLGVNAREIVFTSGGTESNNLALAGVVRELKSQQNLPALVGCGTADHPSVLEAVRALALGGTIQPMLLPVTPEGLLESKTWIEFLARKPALVSLLWANHETGVLQDLVRLGTQARDAGCLVHVDAVQAWGKIPINLANLPADLVSVSAHKIGGPPGCGALWVSPGTPLDAIFDGGQQERGLRGGTENLSGIVGLGVAAVALPHRLIEAARVMALRDGFESEAQKEIPEAEIVAQTSQRVGNTSCATFVGYDGQLLLEQLDMAGFAVSRGAACSAGIGGDPRVLQAMQLDPAIIRGAVRISFGTENVSADVSALIEVIRASLGRQKRSASSNEPAK